MYYRKDPDLEFLKYLRSKDLENLVNILIYDKNNNKRITQQLTLSPQFKKYYPNHNKYWRDIAAELQKYGGNTISNKLRGGKGVLYKEILMDVCDELKVKYNKYAPTKVIENELLLHIARETLNKFSRKELEKLQKQFHLKNNILNKKNLLRLVQIIFKKGGFKSYQLSVSIANSFVKTIAGKGLNFSTNAFLTKSLSVIMGPISKIFFIIWSLKNISGPAYRVTIPAVIVIAVLRKKYEYQQKIKEKLLISFLIIFLFSFLGYILFPIF
jgi:uncharacterized protein YaaW (UPF0174 family)